MDADPEEKLENLNQNLLEEENSTKIDAQSPDEISEEFPPWRRTTNLSESDEPENESNEDESRMIDLPFGLFDD
ncbi:MAG: hypothetical protein Ct9H90mP14_2330 [Methanobacteriota archaeon]|nr:MAG: hypothetical protein Ct9H90mP14_2330 [Euryarchaeota archaeon]